MPCPAWASPGLKRKVKTRVWTRKNSSQKETAPCQAPHAYAKGDSPCPPRTETKLLQREWTGDGRRRGSSRRGRSLPCRGPCPLEVLLKKERETSSLHSSVRFFFRLLIFCPVGQRPFFSLCCSSFSWSRTCPCIFPPLPSSCPFSLEKRPDLGRDKPRAPFHPLSLPLLLLLPMLLFHSDNIPSHRLLADTVEWLLGGFRFGSRARWREALLLHSLFSSLFCVCVSLCGHSASSSNNVCRRGLYVLARRRCAVARFVCRSRIAVVVEQGVREGLCK